MTQDSHDRQQRQEDVVGQLLYKVNPWLMLQLEKDGIYDLVVTGAKLQECKRPPIVFSGAARIFDVVSLVMKVIGAAVVHLFQMVFYASGQLVVASENEMAVKVVPKVDQRAYRISNSHCFYFGIYNFNFTKWQNLDSDELRTWCNKTDGKNYSDVFDYVFWVL